MKNLMVLLLIAATASVTACNSSSTTTSTANGDSSASSSGSATSATSNNNNGGSDTPAAPVQPGNAAPVVATQCANGNQSMSYPSMPGDALESPNKSFVTATQNKPIDSYLPTFWGGSNPTYAISPALPAGLSLNAQTGELSGTPTTGLKSGTTFTVTVSYLDYENSAQQAACEFIYNINAAKISGTFTAIGAMTATRNAPVAALLQNGKVLIIGGSNNGSFLKTAELYDPNTQTFSATGSSAMFGAATATVLGNGKVLIAGGRSASDAVSAVALSLELYDPAQGTFSAAGVASLTHAPVSATLLPNGNAMFMESETKCDVDGGMVHYAAEIFNPNNQTITAASITGGTQATVLANNKVLIRGFKGCAPNAVVGGFDTVFTATAKLYDPAQNTFVGTGKSYIYPSSGNMAPPARAGIALQDGTVFFSDFGNGMSVMQIYDPIQGTFTSDAFETNEDAGKAVAEQGNGNIVLASPSTATLSTYTPGQGKLNVSSAQMIYNHGLAAPSVLLQDGDILVAGKSDGGPNNGEVFNK